MPFFFVDQKLYGRQLDMKLKAIANQYAVQFVVADTNCYLFMSGYQFISQYVG